MRREIDTRWGNIVTRRLMLSLTNQSRDDQELTLVVTNPASSKVRNAQQLTMSVALPNSSKIRYGQDVVLVVLGKGKYPMTCGVT